MQLIYHSFLVFVFLIRASFALGSSNLTQNANGAKTEKPCSQVKSHLLRSKRRKYLNYITISTMHILSALILFHGGKDLRDIS